MAQSPAMMIARRTVQGLGPAILAPSTLAHRVTVAFMTGTGMLALALVLVLTFIMRGGQATENPVSASATS